MDKTIPSPLWPVIRELDRVVSALGRDRLPRTFDELAGCALPRRVLAALRGLVAEGYAEAEIVRAFLEALRPLAVKSSASRELARALRKDFTWNGRRRPLQQRIAVIAAEALKNESRSPATVA